MDTEFVSGRWVCRKFKIGPATLKKIVDGLGDERAGRIQHPFTKRTKFLRVKIEAVMRSEKPKT